MIDSSKAAKAADLLARGMELFSQNKPAEAHAQFRLALNESPNDPKVHAALARTSLLLSAPTLAQFHAQAALAQDPRNLDAVVLSAEAARREGNRELCMQQMAKFAKVPPLRKLHKSLELSFSLEDGQYEPALLEIAALCEEYPEDAVFSGLFKKGFDLFNSISDKSRYLDFLDGLGFSFPSADTAPVQPKGLPGFSSIDVIIPVCRRLEDLKACLTSIEQSGTDAIGKVILIDDCSEPATSRWLQSLAERNPSVTVLRTRETQGFIKAAQHGLFHSRSKLAVVLESNTRVTLGWIEGLWRAMNTSPKTAMVGPVTDNGNAQSIMPPTSVTGPPFKEPADASEHLARAAALVLLNSRKNYPRVPSLAGFCLMIRKTAFETVGGFDTDTFPTSELPIVDLGFKMIDQGMQLVIADDVFVHHTGSTKTKGDQETKAQLVELTKLNERYSALRVLAAEQICLYEPEIRHHSLTWSRHDEMLNKISARQRVDESAIDTRPRRACRILSPTQVDLNSQEACLFVVHAPMGYVSDYTLAYIRAMRSANVYVLLCLVVDDMDITLDTTLIAAADSVMLRLNGGYDFAAWADMLFLCPQVWQADRLYFVNDSMIGPFSSMDPIFDKIRTENAGFFALSEAVYPNYHAQSFFFGWSKANLNAPALRNFWEDIRVQRDKAQVIHLYEHGISPLSRDLPVPSQQIVFGLQVLFGMDPAVISGFNPTHTGWRRMLELGFPFIKTDLVRDQPINISIRDWQTVCKAAGADLNAVNRHLEISRSNRIKTTTKDAHQTSDGDDLGQPAYVQKRRRRIFFHIGMPKTGSSALQAFFSQNAAQLEALGVSYPFAEEFEATEKTSWSGNILPKMVQAALELGEGNLSLIEKADAHCVAVVDAALAESAQSTVLFSGEFMGYAGTQKILRYIERISDRNDVSIIAYVRDVFDHAVSGWKQNVNAISYRGNFDFYVKHIIDQNQMALQRLKSIAQSGVDLKVMNYDYHKHRLVESFLPIIGVDPKSPELVFDRHRIVNPSLSFWQAKMIVAAHELTGSGYLSAMLVDHFRRTPDHRKDPVLAEVDALLINRLAPEIAWANTYLAPSEHLRATPRTDAISGSLAFSDADMMHLMSVFGDYLKAINLPNVVSEKLLAAGLPPDFVAEEYLILNPDVAAAKVNAVEHYLKNGKYEGRNYRVA